MTELETLRELEHDFWTGDADFYRERLASDCRMALPGAGFLSRPEVIQGIADGPRWSKVTMTEEQVTPVSDEAMLLSYRASAEREGEDETYEALVSSCYVADRGDWKLAFHQQTVVG